MSDPKKDDHGKKDDKEPVTKKMMKIGIAVLAAIIFVAFLGATLPELLRQANTTVTAVGLESRNFSRGVDVMVSGFGAFMRALIKPALVGVITYYIILEIIKWIKEAGGKKKNDHHDDHSGGGHDHH